MIYLISGAAFTLSKQCLLLLSEILHELWTWTFAALTCRIHAGLKARGFHARWDMRQQWRIDRAIAKNHWSMQRRAFWHFEWHAMQCNTLLDTLCSYKGRVSTHPPTRHVSDISIIVFWRIVMEMASFNSILLRGTNFPGCASFCSWRYFSSWIQVAEQDAPLIC